MEYGKGAALAPQIYGEVLLPCAKGIVPELEEEKVFEEYKNLILRNPDLGNEQDNPLLPGFYMAAYIIAFHKAYPNAMDGESIGHMVDVLGESELLRKLYANKDFFDEKNIESRAKMALEPDELYPENWKYEFRADPEKRQCVINYRSCAICNMCKREGCFEILKYICKIDFVSQQLMGNTLVRTKTLAEGFDICDFVISSNE